MGQGGAPQQESKESCVWCEPRDRGGPERLPAGLPPSVTLSRGRTASGLRPEGQNLEKVS